MFDPTQLPADLPEPEDDGGARHLPTLPMPPLALPSTAGTTVQLNELGDGRTVLYLYPMTGRPGEALPDGWDAIPGARGCTPETCAFRDHHADLLAAGANAVYGLSSQSTEDQTEAATRLHLPFPLLSDQDLQLATQLQLPTFTAGGQTRYRRLTLIVTAGTIEHVFYPCADRRIIRTRCTSDVCGREMADVADMNGLAGKSERHSMLLGSSLQSQM